MATHCGRIACDLNKRADLNQRAFPLLAKKENKRAVLLLVKNEINPACPLWTGKLPFAVPALISNKKIRLRKTSCDYFDEADRSCAIRLSTENKLACPLCAGELPFAVPAGTAAPE